MKRPKKATKKQDYTKGWETRRRNAAKREREALQSMSRGDADAAQQTIEVQQGRIPGHGEIIGGTDGIEEAAVRICKLARKRGAYGIVNSELRALLHNAANQTRVSEHKATTKRVTDNLNAINERIVCGFIAEVNSLERSYGGLPPDMVLHVGAHTIVRIVDALNRSGYSRGGYTDPHG